MSEDIKLPIDRFTVYWCDCGTHGIHISGCSGTWNGATLRPVEVVRADVHDAKVAELEAKLAQLRKEYREEMREAQRDCQAAYTEGRLEERGIGKGEW